MLLNPKPVWRTLPGTRPAVRLLLHPLAADEERDIREACTHREDDNGKPRFRFDEVAYAERVGQACIRGWEGMQGYDDHDRVVDVPYAPDTVPDVMAVRPIADFVINEVTGLSLYQQQETEQAKNG